MRGLLRHGAGLKEKTTFTPERTLPESLTPRSPDAHRFRRISGFRFYSPSLRFILIEHPQGRLITVT
jgi:hypothetical protein